MYGVTCVPFLFSGNTCLRETSFVRNPRDCKSKTLDKARGSMKFLSFCNVFEDWEVQPLHLYLCEACIPTMLLLQDIPDAREYDPHFYSREACLAKHFRHSWKKTKSFFGSSVHLESINGHSVQFHIRRYFSKRQLMLNCITVLNANY